MQLFLPYIIKLSLSLAVVFLFYWFILRKLTFYNHNRWYLLGYTLLCFFIPFINIAPVVENSSLSQQEFVKWIPVLHTTVTGSTPVDSDHPFDGKQLFVLVLIAGMLIMMTRTILKLLSFRKILQKATLLNKNELSIYSIDEDIIPFSFGNAVFINPRLHSDAELQKIIRHEFVHVKERHSIDIIWAELLCVLNWYNPFVWLLKHCIRQNLEFIADHKVLKNGIDKKAYQYLLLKVAGNNQYSIANQFNFSSLKKRIAMMNKTKSAKAQLLRLLFLLPATAVLLLAFRSTRTAAVKTVLAEEKKVSVAGLVVDSRTLQPVDGATIYCKENNITVTTDARGYYLLKLPFRNEELRFTMLISKDGYQPFLQTEHWGNFYMDGIYNAYSKSIEYFGLGKRKDEGFSSLHSVHGDNALSYEVVSSKLKNIFEKNSPDYDGTIERDTVPAKHSKRAATVSVAAGNTVITTGSGISMYTAESNGTGNSLSNNTLESTGTGSSYTGTATTAAGTDASTLTLARNNETTTTITAREINVNQTENSIKVEDAAIELGDSKRMVILDGKELPQGTKKLKGTFKLKTLSSEEGVTKYGEKGKNGVVEITTQ